MTNSQTNILITIIAYLAGMVGIGFLCGKKSSDTAGDFYLGGRKLGPVVTAMSAEASDMSSWLLMGLPGLAYLSGITGAGWTAIGLAIGTYINWLLIAKRIRCYSQQLDAITLPSFFSKRYGGHKALNAFSAIMIVVFFVPYTASGFAACGKLFASLFQVPYHAALVVSAIVIVGYCALGGFLAASITDLVQSIVMSLAIVIILGFGTYTAGGLDAVIANAQQLPGFFSLTQQHIPGGGAEPYSFFAIVSAIAWGLGYFGMPHILLRFMAIGDAAKLKLSRRIATVWVVISLGVAVAIGVIGNAMSAAGAIPELEGAASETLVITIAHLLSKSGLLAAIIAGVIISGILAATMSTADSQLLVASSSISQDLLQDSFGMKVSEKKAVWIARVTVVLIAAVGVVLAFDPNSSVFDIVSFAWAGFGATFGPVVVFSLFWKRTTYQGVLAGMGAGAVMVFFWKYVVRPLGGMWDVYELLPAFAVASVVILAVTLLTPAPDDAVQKDFEAYQALSKSVQ